MIQGTLPQGRNAFVVLTVIGPTGQRCRLKAMIDTGFDGEFTLPTEVIRQLRLPWKMLGRGELADGSVALFDVYEATVFWDRKRRLVFINETDSIPLIGMSIMEGYTLKMEICPRGKVSLTRLDR